MCFSHETLTPRFYTRTLEHVTDIEPVSSGRPLVLQDGTYISHWTVVDSVEMRPSIERMAPAEFTSLTVYETEAPGSNPGYVITG
jgi:rubrerythrin